jgi:hypothetical protein
MVRWTVMRIDLIRPVFPLAAALLLVAAPQSGAMTPAVDPPAAQEQRAQEQAGWAGLEAERRATDGDYDGAVQAQQEAERDLQAANRLRDEGPVR